MYRFPTSKTVALDLECTGINRDRDRILQYGIYGADAGSVIALHSVVDAQTDVGRDPKNIPGVSLCEVLSATPLRQGHLARIREACDGAVVVIHNKHFDWTFIENEFRRNGAEPPSPRIVCCTWEIARAAVPPPHTLASLCDRFVIPLAGHHNAFHDARATFELFVTFANRYWHRWFNKQPRLRGCWAVRSAYWLPQNFPWVANLVK